MSDAGPESELSDQSLLLRYQRGDRAALGSLVRRHERSVYNFVLRQLGSALEADEVSKKIFLQLAVSPPPSQEGSVRTRLFFHALQLCRRELARSRRRSMDIAPPATSAHSGEAPTQQALEDSIVAAVDALDPAQKEVLLLKEIAKLGFAEIALVVGQSETTVKIQLQQAFRQLQSELKGFAEYQRALTKRAYH